MFPFAEDKKPMGAPKGKAKSPPKAPAKTPPKGKPSAPKPAGAAKRGSRGC